MAGTYEIPQTGNPNSTEDPKTKTMLEGLNEKLTKQNTFGWYKPSIVATEQTRESASFGTLTTPDEVKEVVVPENGLLEIMYRAEAQSSESNVGKVALFFGATQVKTQKGVVEEVTIAGTALRGVVTTVGNENNFLSAPLEPATSTTGQYIGGFVPITVAAGTYNVSMQWKATTGKVTVKNRKLWVRVSGI